MKLNIILFLYVILPIVSLIPQPKLCINCKHFLPDNMYGKYGKCFLFPKKDAKINYLVTGIVNEDYYYCSTVRDIDTACGEEGKLYKKNCTKY